MKGASGMAEGSKGDMTVEEAGRKGGRRGGKRGGETTRDRYGHEFYEEIGRKGGRKVRDLIEAGKKGQP
jgi:general stress protein YciG